MRVSQCISLDQLNAPQLEATLLFRTIGSMVDRFTFIVASIANLPFNFSNQQLRMLLTPTVACIPCKSTRLANVMPEKQGFCRVVILRQFISPGACSQLKLKEQDLRGPDSSLSPGYGAIFEP